MRGIPSHAVDLVICDLPYAIGQVAWREVIDFRKLWHEYHRLAKAKSAILLITPNPSAI